MTTKSITTDTLETLLDLVLETAGPDQVAVGNGGAALEQPDKEWYVMAYWNDMLDDNNGGWDIFVEAASLRAALCQVIAHPRFGQ